VAESLRESVLVLILQIWWGMKQPSLFRGTGWLAFLLATGGGCGTSLQNPDATGAGGSGGIHTGSGGGGTGGGAGQAGGAGASVGGTGGSGVNACLPPSPVYPQLGLGSIVGSQGPYDGPAIVERSVDGELILAYDVPGSGGAGGDAGTVRHVRISGMDVEPRFPPGARVWFSKGQDPTGGFVAPQPRSFSLRSGQGGTLLMGAALNAFTAVSSPVAIGGVQAICTASAADGCSPPGSTVTYSQVTVSGDSPVVVRDGALGEIALDGVRYDVRVTAQMTTQAMGFSTCADYFPFAGVSLDVRAQGLAALAAGLPVGSGPACGQGNDAIPNVSFGIYEVGLPAGFEGPVTYGGLDPLQPGGFLFLLPGRPPLSDGSPARIFIAHATSVLSEPAFGQQFWLSYPDWMSQALFESQGGPVVIARAVGTPQAGALAPLAAALGVGVTLERACSYGSSRDLWRAQFATTPAVSVPSGTTALLAIGGRSHRAWMWNEYDFSLTVVRAN
jgi:hypothetical protein